MGVNFKAMPEKVSRVAGPVIKFDELVDVHEIGTFIAGEEYQHNIHGLDKIEKVQLIIQRDGNYFRDPAFHLTALGGTKDVGLKGLHNGDQRPLGDTVLFTKNDRRYLGEKIESPDRFPVFLEQLETKSKGLLDRFGGHELDGTRHALVNLPYYFWSIAVDYDGEVMSKIDGAYSREVTARSTPTSTIRMPKATNGYNWRRRLKGMSSEGWLRLKDAGILSYVDQDEAGPFVATRSGRIIRPRDALVPTA